MIVKSIELKNFRNYEDLSLKLDDKTNIIYGNNAQGKTNILESIYLAGTSKSHKGSKDKEIIKFGNEESHLRCMVDKSGISYQIDVHLRKNKSKGIAINGIPVKRYSELLGILNIVFFSPEDLDIIKRGPAERRKFVDLELCQLDKVYLHNLTNYNKVLSQRNKLLKELYFQPNLEDTLSIWNMQMVDYAREIIQRRRKFIEELNEIASQVHSKLSGNKENFFVDYEPSQSEDTLEAKLEENIERDKKQKTTSVGPHRDDICFKINDVDIRKYGSQGQQRTAALSLKLAEIELVRRRIKEMPVLLLDDVLSELDSDRQNYLLNTIGNLQTVITCTGLDEFIQHRFEINRVIKVVNGTVQNDNYEDFGNSSGRSAHLLR